MLCFVVVFAVLHGGSLEEPGPIRPGVGESVWVRGGAQQHRQRTGTRQYKEKQIL